jgi:hypothetical protein
VVIRSTDLIHLNLTAQAWPIGTEVRKRYGKKPYRYSQVVGYSFHPVTREVLIITAPNDDPSDENYHFPHEICRPGWLG